MLSPSNPKIPKSIRYHITDIYIDELDKIVPLESAEQDFQEVIVELVKPFVKIQQEGVDKVAKQKATELLDDPRLEEDEESSENVTL
jgi:ribosomal RNA-processing protein 1